MALVEQGVMTLIHREANPRFKGHVKPKTRYNSRVTLMLMLKDEIVGPIEVIAEFRPD